MTNTVYLVGAGPGAPDLLTLRAAKLLAAADIVFHDALVHPDTLALAERAEKIAVGKRCGKHSTAQRFINKRLVDAAKLHRVVVRLKGGDPMLFGRAQEEIAAALIAAGKPATTPIAIVESASLAESRRVFATLDLLPRLASQFSGPAVILIGPQFRAREQSVRNSAVEEDSAPTPGRRAQSTTD